MLKFWLASLGLGALALAASAQTYTLVQGLDKFEGSTAAWHLLETNGFVVTDPSFKHMFTPYADGSMLPFITTDSAWHAYRVLLAQGLQDLETAQAPRLADFSRLLLAAANEQAKSRGPDFSDLARFAAIGLALQDKTVRASLPADQKRLADALLKGRDEVQPEIGLPLRAEEFKQAGKTASPERVGYAAARKWYALVEFRISDARETRLALCLAWLVHHEPGLLQSWQQLSAPWDALLGPMEEIPLYWNEAVKMLGPNFTAADLLKRAPDLQSRLAGATSGFHVLPVRDSSAAICFQTMAGPKISGLDFLAASPSLRSRAAERALQNADGATAVEAARRADVGPLSDSLRGRALELLADLQKPLPVRLGPALRSEAWADAQVWSQLGAWADADHFETSRRKARMDDFQGGMGEKPPAGVVAPYPEFFTGLGRVALETADSLEKAGIDEPFDAKTTARKLLECLLWREGIGTKSEEEYERMAGPLAQFERFALQYRKPQAAERPTRTGVSLEVVNNLEVLARRCSTQTAPDEADRGALLKFFEARQTVPKVLHDFAPFCDKLAELARKHLDGTALTDADAEWISNYGMALESFEAPGSSPMDPSNDDFPTVNRVRSDSAGKAAFYAGLGLPQALYIILPAGGRLRLYRGAVLAYREFAGADNIPSPAEGGQMPPPAFTRSFRVERDAADLIKSFTETDPDSRDDREMTDAMEELQARVTDRDLPGLIAALGKLEDTMGSPAAAGIASAIGKLHWEPRQRELFALMETNDGAAAQVVAPIFLQRPEGVDGVFLSANFERAPARARRVYCALLSHVVPQTDQTRNVLLRALADPAPGVRWAAAAAADGAARDAAEWVPALVKQLSDENQYVAAMAAGDLERIHATNAAPALLASLEARVKGPEPSIEELRKENEAVRDFFLNSALEQAQIMNSPPAPNVGRMRRFGGGLAMRLDEAPAPSAMIEALGSLHYQPAEEQIFGLLDGPYSASAGKALKQLAPDKLAERLMSIACDKKADGPTRDRALAIMETPPVSGSVKALVPLLDDTTTVPGRRPMPGREWRICDRAAETISALLGHPIKIVPMQTADQRDQQIEQIRQSLKAEY